MATKRKYIKRRGSRKIRGGTIFGHSMRVAKAQREKKQKDDAAAKRRREKALADKAIADKAKAVKAAKAARLASSLPVAEGPSESITVPVIEVDKDTEAKSAGAMITEAGEEEEEEE